MLMNQPLFHERFGSKRLEERTDVSDAPISVYHNISVVAIFDLNDMA